MTESGVPRRARPVGAPAAPTPEEPIARSETASHPPPSGPPQPRPGDGAWQPEYGELAPRPRRKLISPLNLGLLAVLLLALGFVGGVLVEKRQASNDAASGRAALRGALAGAGTGATGTAGAGALGLGRPTGGAAARAMIGAVSTVDGHTLYVTDSQGNTIKVTSSSGGTITRTARSSLPSIHPGDAVVVQGPKNSDGSISAVSIRATAANSSGGSFAGLFGAGGAGGGGASPSGSSGGGGGFSGGGTGGAGGGSSPSGSPRLFGPR
jgi:hypothetical protein